MNALGTVYDVRIISAITPAAATTTGGLRGTAKG